MAQFFKPAERKKAPQKQFNLALHDLDLKGQGVGRWQQRMVFVAGGLPGDTVRVTADIPAKGPIHAALQEVLTPSDERDTPLCSHYQVCGGCQLQHLKAQRQIEYKQIALERLLKKRQINVSQWAAPVLSEQQIAYRTKARLAVDCRKQVKLGFRNAENNRILNISECIVLAPELQALIAPIKSLLGSLNEAAKVGHVDVQLSQGNVGIWLHRTTPWSKADKKTLDAWLEAHQVTWLAEETSLSYPLNEFGLTLNYLKNDFVQSNLAVNAKMVQQAIEWLELTGEEHVLDLFCGIGNFSLPLAQHSRTVIGVEGVTDMVCRAIENAEMNGVENVKFAQADLSKPLNQQAWWRPVDVILMDPARAGAEQVVTQLPKTKANKVLYVSCNPATLVRDAAILMSHGYEAVKAGVLDMFPQTHHLESMILFSKVTSKK
ncbi:23S rRNA (uracil(1939)-C(5))-methyltransferase RlmD [Echinimonas agarilytica]|uniref:23S rRNA (Uracil(1939)-C(5))-methyltransferase RlmD n=1 Tax=Echinimonas agarilytica TaxID=1215918 RepID=A0AA41W4W4_9GAMM|nr:23S rRNA (uracil(1939)-C(5))-methyltransferase RlmD [Echinimonas agarilytica]MCM2678828.1 23S rRNA (uracil(1939)-C(5))-methyltransferase RlmD [Echinimonas agarilytica]